MSDPFLRELRTTGIQATMPFEAKMTDDSINRILGICGTVSGVAGTLISLYTLRHQLVSDRVKVRVSCVFVTPLSRSGEKLPPTIGIEVVNLSKFPIRITSVGIENHDETRSFFKEQRVHPAGAFPLTIDSRDKVTIYPLSDALLESGLDVAKTVFATTACGMTFREKKSNVLKHIAAVRRRIRG